VLQRVLVLQQHKFLAEAGSDVFITGRDLDGLKETQKNIESLGRKCLIIEADLFSGK
jgi:Short-chain dehydrogenases of various substrate specificities